MLKKFLCFVTMCCASVSLFAVNQSSSKAVCESFFKACIAEDVLSYVQCLAPAVFAEAVEKKELEKPMNEVMPVKESYQAASAAEKRKILDAVVEELASKTVRIGRKWYLGDVNCKKVNHDSAESVAACMAWALLTGNAAVAIECIAPAERGGKNANEIKSKLPAIQKELAESLSKAPQKKQFEAIYAMIAELKKNAIEVDGKWYFGEK